MVKQTLSYAIIGAALFIGGGFGAYAGAYLAGKAASWLLLGV